MRLFSALIFGIDGEQVSALAVIETAGDLFEARGLAPLIFFIQVKSTNSTVSQREIGPVAEAVVSRIRKRLGLQSQT